MKKTIFSLFVFATLLLSMNFVFANIMNITTPINGIEINGTDYILNASLYSNDLNITNVSWYYQLNASTDWVFIGSTENISSQQIYFNYSWDTTALEDEEFLTLNITGINATDSDILLFNLSTKTIRVNNGLPTSTYASNSFEQYGSAYISTGGFILGLATASDIGITNCSISMNSILVNLLASSNACSSTLTSSNFSITSAGEYTYTITAHDDNGDSTASSTRQLSIYSNPSGGTGGGGTPAIASSQEQATTTTKDTGIGISQTAFGGFGDRVGASFSNIGTGFRNFFGGIGDFFNRIFRRG